MQTQHTPGPWIIHAPANAAFVRHPSIVSDTGEVAKATWASSERQTNANARLIVAAPDLLAAIEGLLNALPSATTHPAIKAARAAIARATGQP